MASSSTVHAPERSKLEQIVVEFFAKSLHIILESRIPALCGEGDCLRSSASSLSSGPKTRDRWFNLALGDCTAALENFETWRRDFSDPMVVDIILDQPKSAERNPSLPRVAPFNHQHWAKGGFLPLKGTAEVSSSSVDEGTVLERWTVQFEQRKKGSPGSKGASGVKAGAGPDVKRVGSIGAGEVQEMRTDSKELWSGGSGSGSRSQNTRIEIGESAARGGGSLLPTHVTEVPAVYKRTVVMLRSLYSKCRLLPAYRLFRLSNSPSNCCNFSLSYRVLSSAAPLSEHDKRDMREYSFTPVETAYGRMRLSVAYRHTTAVIAMEVAPSIRPRIIPDYVGSPTTDPLKRFTGEPHSLPSSGMPINRGIHIVSVPSSLQNSPPGLGLGRRHSWSGRINQIQPALQPPSSPSYRISRSPSPSHPFHPSPAYLPSPYSPFSQKHPSSDLSLSPLSSPVSSADRLSVLHPAIFTKHVSPSQPISIDNRCSPPFLSSPSPSPPTLYPGSQPVSIPKPCHTRGSKFPTGDIHQRSRNSLPPLSPSARKTGPLLRSSSESPRYSAQLLSHAHQSRSFESPLQLHVLHDDHGQQVWRNEGSGPFSAENIFSGQSQETLSRSSSKTALGDDGEDEDFSCPFAVDDMDAGEKRSSKSDNVGPRGEIPESSFGTLQQRSQDAAVGALIRMLKSAPPLRHSFYPAMEMTDSSLAFGANERELMSRSPTCLVPERMMGRVQDVLLEPLSTMHITKTLKDALGEFQLYKNMRDAMHMHRGEEEVGHTLIGSSMLPG